MEGLHLILYLAIFIALYLFICDCILKKKEDFLHQQGFNLIRDGIEDVNAGGYFGNIKEKEDEHGAYVPLRVISSTEKKQMVSLVRPILKKINRQLKLKFEVVDIESFYQQVEESGNVRLKLDVFVLETLNHYNRRLLLDITLDYTVNKLIVNQITLANAKELKKIDTTKPRHQYFEQPILQLDNQNKLEADTDIYGVGDSKLAQGKLDFTHQHIEDKNFTSWVFPQEYLEKINSSLPVWPCRSEKFIWDTNAVSETQMGENTCQGINTSYHKRDYIPKFDPGMRQAHKEGEYNWIFGFIGKGGGGYGGGGLSGWSGHIASPYVTSS
jgi:hypothetical protein